MVAFLVTIGIIGVLIVCGVRVSLYLYKHGAFNRRRFRRSRGDQMLVEEDIAGEADDEVDNGVQSFMIVTEGEAETAIYARRGLLICLGGLTLIALLISTVAHFAMH